MDLNEMLVFARVVQAGSFTAAAAVLGMPKSTVSRKVSDLEERLHARLIQRTTRKLSLTDAGRTYYDYCVRIAGEIEEAENAVGNLQDEPRGLLRVTAPVNMSPLAPIISEYLKRNPEVRLELLCTARIVDLVEEGFDVAIRAGRLADSTLVARSLGSVRWFLVAAPTYLKKRGRPRSPEDLRKHDCLLFGVGPDTGRLRLENGERSVDVEIEPRMTVSDIDILHEAALSGLGIGVISAFQCGKDVNARRLERVLGDWSAPAAPLHAVYPSTRHLSAKVRSFIDHLEKSMNPSPWELGPAPSSRSSNR
jgi:DNA-binding transcriptional LysR family regulator